MAHHDFPASAFPDRPVPGVLTFPNQEPLHVAARLGVEPPYADGTKPETWWADLSFHPLGPPAQDAECTLHFGGTIGRGHIAAGSTRMLGDGPPPTIRVAYVEDEGDPEMTARPDPAPKPNARGERLATVDPSGHLTYAWSDVPPTTDWDRHIANGGDLLKDLQDAQRKLRQDDLIAQLGNMTANLSEYIERRAQELAQPLIDEAREAAAVEVKDAQTGQQRAEDLVTELRRQLAALERNRERYRQRAETAENAITTARITMRANTRPVPNHPTDYQRGYQACADEVGAALNDTTEGTPA